VILCLVAGLIELFRQVKRLLVFFILLFGTTLLYAVNYDIFDIDSYFLLSYLIAGFIIAYGIFSLLGWRQSNKPWAKIGIAVLIGILPVMQLLAHWEHVDETWNTVPHQFIEKAFSDLEPHAIVIASSWDYFISPSLYYQLIRHERRDVTIVDKSLLQDRTWYFLHLEQNAPWLMERIRPYADLFLLELEKFEHGIPLNYQVIRTRWQTLLSQIVEQSLPDRPVYIDVRIDQEFSPEYKRIPSGLFLRLAKTADSAYYRPATISLPSWKNNSPVTKDFTLYYSTILLKDAYWLIQKGEMDRARKILQEIFVLDPGNPEANWLVQQVSKK
jgi:hypothetical protein